MPNGDVPPVPIHLLPPACRPCCSASRSLSVCDELRPAAESFDSRLVLGRERVWHRIAQPVVGNRLHQRGDDVLDALEVAGECAIEAIEVPLVLHERGARQVVELLRHRSSRRAARALRASVRNSVVVTGRPSRRRSKKNLTSIAAVQEHQLLEEVHVLLVLEERAVERRDDLLLIARGEHRRVDVFGEQQLQPVDQLRGRRLLLQSRRFANAKEGVQRLASEAPA